MENKINVAELLKDCPKGMELDCTMYDNCTFDGIDDVGYTEILVRTPSGRIRLTKEGCFTHNDKYAKCVIFPKGKTTWEGFQRPFKEGDIVVYDNPHRNNLQVFIFKNKEENNALSTCYLMLDGDELDLEEGMYYITRLATEEEKQKLFDAIKENGYKWNAKTKTLEKLPKFKVENKIEKCGYRFTIVEIKDNYYLTKCGNKIPIDNQDDFSLVPNKFDITTLKPFDKVLVRDHNAQEWVASLFSNYNEPKKYKYICVNGSGYAQCILYENNEYLLGTTDDCDEYYKTWE